jgi:hypothetical protein
VSCGRQWVCLSKQAKEDGSGGGNNDGNVVLPDRRSVINSPNGTKVVGVRLTKYDDGTQDETGLSVGKVCAGKGTKDVGTVATSGGGQHSLFLVKQYREA